MFQKEEEMPVANKQEIPTTFQEGKNFNLEIFRERPSMDGYGKMVWWQTSSASTIQGCFKTLKYIEDGNQVRVVAQYSRGKVEAEIGKGTYRKRGPYGQLETLETIEAEGAMIGLVETALVELEEERHAAEEAARTYPCDYPGCTEDVLVAVGPAYTIKILAEEEEQTLAFYGCPGMHYEALAHPDAISATLQLRRSATSSVRRTVSDAHLLDLRVQTQDEVLES